MQFCTMPEAESGECVRQARMVSGWAFPDAMQKISCARACVPHASAGVTCRRSDLRMRRQRSSQCVMTGLTESSSAGANLEHRTFSCADISLCVLTTPLRPGHLKVRIKLRESLILSLNLSVSLDQSCNMIRSNFMHETAYLSSCMLHPMQTPPQWPIWHVSLSCRISQNVYAGHCQWQCCASLA